MTCISCSRIFPRQKKTNLPVALGLDEKRFSTVEDVELQHAWTGPGANATELAL